jgi:hypothetical protein
MSSHVDEEVIHDVGIVTLKGYTYWLHGQGQK